MIRGYVWKQRTGASKPWIVAFVDSERPGVEVWEGRDFRRWRSAFRWADQVARDIRGGEEQG